jgi:hypothetical protein
MITDELRIAPWLLDIQTIYLQPEVESFPRGREILSAFPNAERVLVDSHWKIPGLHGFEGNVDDWIKIKRSILVLGIKSSLSVRPNARSSDFIAPSHANGCAMPCSYCYVPRRKGFANPITEFVNILGYDSPFKDLLPPPEPITLAKQTIDTQTSERSELGFAMTLPFFSFRSAQKPNGTHSHSNNIQPCRA